MNKHPRMCFGALATMRIAAALVALTATFMNPVTAAETPSQEGIGSTKVLQWKDGKQAVFMLEFDDSAPSAVHHAIPELKKRGMTGTFYINPGNPPYKSLRGEWEGACLGAGIEYANHTFTHVGATSVPQLDEELAKCNEVIKACYPERKWPRLVSFGRPGGVPWTVPEEEKKALLAKHHLVERPPFFGYPFQIKTQEQVLALVDAALASGGMGHHDFHGVGGDWHVTPLEVYNALLDKLEANRDKLWITDPVSWHQYAAERDGAKVEVLRAAADGMQIRLTSTADPVFYDLPLTLSTRVPADWKSCEVVQGGAKTTVAVRDGAAVYSALPAGETISLLPVKP